MGDERMETPRVTIVIPAFNAQDTIGLCLDSVSRMLYPRDKLEVIVVDNGSDDQTVEISRRYGVEVHIKPGIFIGEMRNFGVARATGDVLGFVDSDCILSETWLISAIRHLADPSVAVAGCGYDCLDPPGWIERHWLYLNSKPAREVNFVPSGNMLVKKAAFIKVGGFNADLETGEDTDMCLRLRKEGLKIISDNRIRNIHLGNPRSLRKFFLKEIWYGRGLSACISTDNWKDRTFLLTNIFLSGLLSSALGLILLLCANSSWLALLGLSIIGFVVLFSTCYRTIRKGRLSSFFHLLILNTAHYLGRSIALLMVYSKLCRRYARSLAKIRTT